MTNKDRRDAAVALLDWFNSQDIGFDDMGSVMTLVLAAIIHAVANDAADKKVGVEVLKADILTALEGMAS